MRSLDARIISSPGSLKGQRPLESGSSVEGTAENRYISDKFGNALDSIAPIVDKNVKMR